MNSVNVIGRLTRDPESKQTTSGTKVAEFTIAVDKRNKDEGANFFRVKAWGNQADFVQNYLSKGRLVSITGRLEHRKWQDKEGGNRETVEIVAESVQGLDRPRDDAQPTQTKTTTGGAGEYDPWEDE